MNLLEVIAPQCRILSEEVDEATKERVMRVEVKWQHAGIINGNRRRYSKAILKREIDRLSPLCAEGRVSGCAYHPEKGAELDDVSHLWESIKMESDGSCTGVVRVIPTSRGRNAQSILKAGGHIGMSSRGVGSVTKKEEVVDGKKITVEEVNADFRLTSPGDFVLSPSVPDAGTMRMLEGKLDEQGDQSVTLEQLEAWGLQPVDVTEEVLRQRYEFAIRCGYKGDYASYRKQFEKG